MIDGHLSTETVLLLNSDLGEIADPDHRVERLVMPLIDMANIACGFHAGSPEKMAGTLAIALAHNVAVGAHPGYNDRDNFGRISVPHGREELSALIRVQVAALDRLARNLGLEVDYVKPHGALYNDMMADRDIRNAVLAALTSDEMPRKLVMLATGDSERHRREAQKYGIEVLFEAFADRRYDDSGRLLSRSRPGAVHDREAMLRQVQQLVEDGAVTSDSGKVIPVDAQTLCIHGDSPESVAALNDICRLVKDRRR